ncbi:MAG: DUF5320 domain-containing protein [Spirochaetaceae bacterium]|jgi:hypothetical protein|nr:DUF5320 domain-containing protein [Spirochaetaceae bacterium]
MPRGDRMGPQGLGAKTGRGAGLCTGNKEPGYLNDSGGRGFFRGGAAWPGQGRRAGRRMGGGGGRFFGAPLEYRSTLTPQEEKNFLQQDADRLKEQMDVIQQRINLLEKE